MATDKVSNKPDGDGGKASSGKEANVQANKEQSALGAYDVTEHMLSGEECAEKLCTQYNAQNPSKSLGLSSDEVRFANASVLEMYPCIACPSACASA